jgi:hypothetical protein
MSNPFSKKQKHMFDQEKARKQFESHRNKSKSKSKSKILSDFSYNSELSPDLNRYSTPSSPICSKCKYSKNGNIQMCSKHKLPSAHYSITSNKSKIYRNKKGDFGSRSPTLYSTDSYLKKEVVNSKKNSRRKIKKRNPKKSQNRKVQPKKSQNRKVQPKKSQNRKVQPKKSQTRKVQPKKSQNRKVQPKKSQNRKVQPKKSQTRKVQPKKSQTQRPKKSQTRKVQPKKSQTRRVQPKKSKNQKTKKLRPWR